MVDAHFFTEWTAALLGALYLWLIAKKSKWAWLAGGLSSFLYIFVFYHSKVYAQSYLSIAYVGMSVYAFWSWSREGEVKLVRWKLSQHLQAILLIFLVGAVIVYTQKENLPHFEEKKTFLLDLYIALFSFYATILGILKEKTNWIYWLFINFACICLFVQQGLFPTALLYLSYFLLGIYGLIQWNKKQ